MKKISLIACVLLVTGFTFAQRNKVETPTMTEGQLQDVNKATAKKNDLKQTPVTTSVNPNGANSTTKPNTNKGGNAAQSRSSEEFQASLEGIIRTEYGKMRTKPTMDEPKNDEEAKKQMDQLRSNSKSGIERAEEKIKIAQERLDELMAAGDISEDEYDSKVEELEAISKRTEALKSSLK